MTAGYLYAFLSLGSFGVLGILSKVAEAENCRPSAISALTCMWSAVMLSGFLMVFMHSGVGAPAKVIWVAIPFGVIMAFSNIAFLAGLKYGKVSTSWLIINLSAAVPALASIVVYREDVTLTKAAGLGIAIAALILLYKDKESEELEHQTKASEGRQKSS